MLLLGIGCGLLLVMAAPVATLAAVLLLPSGIAWLSNRSASNALTRSVLVAGLAMSVGPVARLWAVGAEWTVSAEILADGRTLASAWAAQGGAWLAGELVPLMVRLVLDVLAATRAARLRTVRKRLEADWGLPAAAPVRDP
jgi:hypothetical protein